MKFFVFLLTVVVAVVVMKYTDTLVRFFGKSGMSEQYLGAGGTYTMWKLIAVAIILGGLFYWLPPAFLK